MWSRHPEPNAADTRDRTVQLSTETSDGKSNIVKRTPETDREARDRTWRDNSEPRKRSGYAGSSRRSNRRETGAFASSKCYIALLPDELLIHILANLEPTEMKAASRVCSRWHRVIADDGCWRSAFDIYYGCLPIRRLAETSWRKEYLKRTRLLRSFQRGKHVVQFDPRIGKIDQVFLDFEEGRMACGSLEKGMVAFCHPSTGRVEKGTVYFNDNRVPTQIAALQLDRHRIAVGYISGGVALVTDFRDRINYTVRRFAGLHLGPVTCLAWVPNLPSAFISGGNDGTVKVWDVAQSQCIRTLRGPTAGVGITTLACDRKGYVLAGTDHGDLLVWDLDLASVEYGSPPLEMPIPASRVLRFGQTTEDAKIVSLLYDPTADTALGIVGSPANIDGSIRQWNVRTGEVLVNFIGGHAAEISSAAWDRTNPGSSSHGDNRILLATGDVLGTVSIWDVPQPRLSADSTHETMTARPVHVIDAHRASVCALHIDAFKVVSGAEDGSAKVFDILTGRCIRTLLVRRTRGGNDGLNAVGGGGVADGRRMVRCIWAGPYQVIVGSGDHVKSWDFVTSTASATSGKGKKKSSAPNGRRGPARGLRGNAHENTWLEIRDEVRESRLEREYEREAEEWSRKQAQKINGVHPPTGMSEEELINYAMLMSLEEQKDTGHDKALMDALEQSLLDENSVPRNDDEEDLVSEEPHVDLDWNLDSTTDPSTTCSSWDDSKGWGNQSRRGSRLMVYGSSTGSASSVSGSRSSLWEHVAERYEVREKAGNKLQGNVKVASRVPTGGYSSQNRGTEEDDEELQYVLELSLVDK
ncbi:uncharacterized protein SPPG_03455 [Spizellomyces punctatus DAOM BR117]|uniref:F-box domain-containing protein n=1 Tax=Spizellomyces punctatus (strain DAOM BR117) TaxID=645134 RepID=A0A0L0HKN3_SPIPD|nr:uncharacterized protein SPPG_03455 [Spizellomyces punctatus DAOM BR117]KND01657.1 hypothetical protein SPPG_03455 [Spizellomyces punctatus DAOM BR117]|eukprot:XP_016609696.1 hypothetical protein SPPG_03455 [Spizellomyces punctatus DAOM BR117]